jgi:hypothetical protein
MKGQSSSHVSSFPSIVNYSFSPSFIIVSFVGSTGVNSSLPHFTFHDMEGIIHQCSYYYHQLIITTYAFFNTLIIAIDHHIVCIYQHIVLVFRHQWLSSSRASSWPGPGNREVYSWRTLASVRSRFQKGKIVQSRGKQLKYIIWLACSKQSEFIIQDWLLWLFYLVSISATSWTCTSALSRRSLLIRVSLTSIS